MEIEETQTGSRFQVSEARFGEYTASDICFLNSTHHHLTPDILLLKRPKVTVMPYLFSKFLINF